MNDFPWRATLLPLALTLSACTTLPLPAVERALFIDLYKNVELSEDTGWVIDKVELDDNLEATLHSVCQAPKSAREGLDRWLTHRIHETGGPVRQAFEANGGDLGALSEPLTLERIQALLRNGVRQADAHCPFWLRPDPAFVGIEGDAHRVVFLVESAGFGAVLFERGDPDLAGGGAARVLVGYGVDANIMVALGPELGGNGVLSGQMGRDELDTAITGAVPLLVRLTDMSTLYDFEIAPVVRFNSAEKVFPPGVRLAIGGGLAGLRSGTLMPYGIVWLGYEYHPGSSLSPPDHSIRLGTRFGIDWDP